MKTKTGATVLLSSLAIFLALCVPTSLAEAKLYQLLQTDEISKDCPKSFESREMILAHIKKLEREFTKLNLAKDNGIQGNGTYYFVRRGTVGTLDWVADLAMGRDRVVLEIQIQQVYSGERDIYSSDFSFCHYVKDADLATVPSPPLGF